MSGRRVGTLRARSCNSTGPTSFRCGVTAAPGTRVAPACQATTHPGDADMITTQWPERPPEPDTDRSVRWEGSPRGAADLTRLRREVHALVAQPPEQDPDPDDLDRLLLIFEELVSNGLRHGRPPVHVLLETVPTGWLLDVSDAAADRPPVPAHGRDAAAGGMGLPLVAQLATAHGWTVRGARKHVWARIDTAPLSRSYLTASHQARHVTEPSHGGVTGERALVRIRGVIDDRAPVLGFRPALRVTGPVTELPSDVVTDLLAVLDEALTNVARHARAGSVDVDLAVTVDDTILRVNDDGVGMAEARRNVGLADLSRRAAWHGGTLDMQPGPAGGTRLTWSVPRRPTVQPSRS
jgi:two-component sensor histidine kinase